MKRRRLPAIICVGIGIALAVFFAGSGCKQARFLNAQKLISALHAFAQDQAAAGRPLPAEVSLEVLLRGGYLTTNDVKGFAGLELTFSTQADDTNPQMILARARTADGQFICLLADGSVQQFSRSRYEEMLRNSGRPNVAARQNQAVHSETNSRPAGAGSR